MPSMNETTGIRYLKILLASPSNIAELISTMLPVCAFAKTPPRDIYVYAS